MIAGRGDGEGAVRGQVAAAGQRPTGRDLPGLDDGGAADLRLVDTAPAATFELSTAPVPSRELSTAPGSILTPVTAPSAIFAVVTAEAARSVVDTFGGVQCGDVGVDGDQGGLDVARDIGGDASPGNGYPRLWWCRRWSPSWCLLRA